jgi:para-nitrobenzyl esterase
MKDDDPVTSPNGWVGLMQTFSQRSAQGIRSLPLLLLLLSAWSNAAAAAVPPVPEAIVDGQLLKGEWVAGQKRVAAFRGVPFAAPPVGDLRWRLPRPLLSTAGVRQAQQFAPACMQARSMIDWYARVAGAFGHGPEVVEGPVGTSEDCLYLNVWTPVEETGPGLPVLVFVHGGSNAGGWSYEPNLRGANLAAGGAVVVSVAYRLGVFGFFAHPALEEEAGVPAANFALHDLRVAFRWVREHIAAFGGDPGRVTAFGESSGALNLVDLLAASRGDGTPPFQRLVLQSLGGSLSERQTLAEEQATGTALIGHLGLSGEVSAQRIRDIPAAELLAAVEKLPEEHYHDGVIDGHLLTAAPADILAGSDLADAELIVGTNADEWLMYLPEDSGEAELQAWIEAHAPGSTEALKALPGNEADPRRRLDRLRTAREMQCPSLWLAGRVSAAGGSGRAYQFRRVRTGAGGVILGAYHGAELPYVFATHDDWLPTDSADRRLTAAMQAYWLAFARTGKPDVSGQPAWPMYRDDAPDVLVFGDVITPSRSRARDLCDLFGPVTTAGGP